MYILTLSKLNYWIKLSRPRFWLYVLGPYLIGLAAATTSVYQWWRLDLWLWLSYFLFPANLYLYGINDACDADTDAFNQEKKGKQEHVINPANEKWLRQIIGVIGQASLLMGVATLSGWSFVYLIFFLLLSTVYSTKPLRLKSRPGADFLSNVLYVLPAGVAWSMLTNTPLPWLTLITSGVWCGAMHLFSAIPDIKADTQANLRTTAVMLGKKKSLVLCSLLWLAAAGGAIRALGGVGLLAIVYTIIPLLLLDKPTSVIRRIYWYFPMLNGLFGFGLFWWVLWR